MKQSNSKKRARSADAAPGIPRTASEVISRLSPDRTLTFRNLEGVVAFTKQRLKTAEPGSELEHYLRETKSHAAVALAIARDAEKFWKAYDEILDDLRYVAMLEDDSAAASA